MLKERIKFKDHDGNDQEKDFYFHLSKADLVELEMDRGGLDTYLSNIINSGDTREIMKNFKEIFTRAYGVKTATNDFVKRAEETEKFFASEAWSEFLIKLISDADYAAQVIRSLVPADLAEQADKAQQAKDGFRPGADTTPPPAAYGLTAREEFEARHAERKARQESADEDTQPSVPE